MFSPPPSPELLAPVGSLDCLPAAVAGGADAVYLGCGTLNARARADNIPIELLDDVVSYLHGHRRRCLLTLNTIIGPGRWDQAIALAQRAHQAGVDALIVQDLGLSAALRAALPDLRLHASTQMTVHEPGQIPALARLGLRRVVLARELGPAEVTACASTAAAHGVEIECFVHGALCYGFSGQCLISAARDGRSADHGRCAQNCRFAYHIDQQPGQPLAMRDLCLIDHLPAVIAAGVAALKIEGRLKDPLYVYTVSRCYREALDALAAGRRPDGDLRQRLRRVFSRPFTAGPWQGGSKARLDQEAEPAEVRLISGSRREAWAILETDLDLHAGLGLRRCADDSHHDDGFTIIAAQALGTKRWRCRLRLRRQGPALAAGSLWVVNSDQALAGSAQAAMAPVALPRLAPRRTPVEIRIEAVTGQPVRLQLWAADGRQVTVDGPVAQKAKQRPLDPATVAEACGSLHGQGLDCRQVLVNGDGQAFLPQRTIKDLRRQACDRWQSLPCPDDQSQRIALPSWPTCPGRRPVHVAVDAPSAAAIALAAGADAVWLSDPLCDWSATRPSPAYAALPDQVLLRPPAALACPALGAHWPAGIVAGQWAVIDQARSQGQPVIADAGFKVANPMTARLLLDHGAWTWLHDPAEAWAHGQAPLITDSQGWAGLVLAWGHPVLMQSRHDHGLAPGQDLYLDGPHHGYRLVRHACGLNLIHRREPVDQRAAATALPCGWLLEMAGCSHPVIEHLVSETRRQLDGD